MTATILEVQHQDDIRGSRLAYIERGTIDLQRIIASTNFTLYRLEDAKRRVLFVEVPTGIELSQAAFAPDAQHRHARRLYAVPYEACHRIAEGLVDPVSLIFVYSTGYCGSTLLHRLFNETDVVKSLSEPQVYLEAAWLRGSNSSRSTELRDLLRTATRILCRAHTGTSAIKLPAPAIEIADLLRDAFPSSRAIFLYRNAEAMLGSLMRTHDQLRDRMKPYEIGFWANLYPLLKPYIDAPEELSLAQARAAWWLCPMRRYADLFDSGIWTCAVRYEDMVADPIRIIARLFERCGVPPSQVQKALFAFERHSKSGERISMEELAARRRDGCLDDGELAAIREHIARDPLISDPDVILPGTLR